MAGPHKKGASYAVGDWLAIKDFARDLPKEIPKSIPPALLRHSPSFRSYFMASAIMIARSNAPLTRILKKSQSPLIDQKQLLNPNSGHFGVFPVKGKGAIWGVKAGGKWKSKASVSSKFGSMADLVIWLNGSTDISSPKDFTYTISKKAAMMFSMVANAINESYKAGKAMAATKAAKAAAKKSPRSSRSAAQPRPMKARPPRKPLTGRAKQIYAVLKAKGYGKSKPFYPPKAGTVVRVPGRGIFKRMWGLKIVQKAFIDATKEAVGGAVMNSLAKAQARYQAEAGKVWGHNGKPLRPGR